MPATEFYSVAGFKLFSPIQHFQPHTCKPHSIQPDDFCRAVREIDDALWLDRPAVINADFHLAAILEISNFQLCAERICPVRGGEIIFMENFAVRCFPSVEFFS